MLICISLDMLTSEFIIIDNFSAHYCILRPKQNL